MLPLPVASCSQDAFNRVLSKVLSNDASLLAADGTTPSTTALYRMDLSAGQAMLGGVYIDQAALTDTVLIGTGTWGNSYDLLGQAAVVIPTNGYTCYYALVLIPVGTSAGLYAVFGDAALDGDEEIPTDAQIVQAMKLALGENYDERYGLLLNWVKVQRGVRTITITAVDPAADDNLKARRLAGTLTP